MSDAAQGRVPIRRALVSVYDKSGLDALVRGLHEAGVALVSTGGSAALIEGLGLPVTRVEELTGFPERDATGALRYAASNQVGDAVLLYSLTLGPLWAEVARRSPQ